MREKKSPDVRAKFPRKGEERNELGTRKVEEKAAVRDGKMGERERDFTASLR